ncbi:MAG: rhodanese-like domain-containing protein [Bdellovibrionaceae bacterium]|nr:rhodanese-like domain-containing protein [Bdellovibrionales bacterium]MCB9083475.1 rhodanese-like domain-containing protein [Pseudobdellovibrionaceae bacterium]
MKITRWILTLAATLIAGSYLSSAWTADAVDFKKVAVEVNKNDAILLDVREISELQEEGLAKGALWLPNSEIRIASKGWEAFLRQTPKDKKIYIYCRSGGRAGQVQQRLKDKGYLSVINIGGLKDWKAQGLPTIPFGSQKGGPKPNDGKD